MTVKDLKRCLENFKDDSEVIVEWPGSDDYGRYDPFRVNGLVIAKDSAFRWNKRFDNPREVMIVLTEDKYCESQGYEIIR